MAKEKKTKGENDEELIEAMRKMGKKLRDEQKPLDPEISKIVDDHFWELI